MILCFVGIGDIPSWNIHTNFIPELQSNDWSDDDDDDDISASLPFQQEPLDQKQAMRRIRQLEEKVRRNRQEFADYRRLVSEQLNLASLAESLRDHVSPSSSKNTIVPSRDDDSHYFQSYGENGGFELI
jgi:type I protein arginine methyltransferase